MPPDVGHPVAVRGRSISSRHTHWDSCWLAPLIQAAAKTNIRRTAQVNGPSPTPSRSRATCHCVGGRAPAPAVRPAAHRGLGSPADADLLSRQSRAITVELRSSTAFPGPPAAASLTRSLDPSGTGPSRPLGGGVSAEVRALPDPGWYVTEEESSDLSGHLRLPQPCIQGTTMYV